MHSIDSHFLTTIRRQRYTIGEKKKIAREAKKASLRSVAVKYNVDRRCIRDWVNQDNAGAFDEESPCCL